MCLNAVRSSCAGPARRLSGPDRVYRTVQPLVCKGGWVLFDSLDPATFDPFQMMDAKGVTCLSFAQQVTGNSDGFIEDLGQLGTLIKDGFVIQTDLRQSPAEAPWPPDKH